MIVFDPVGVGLVAVPLPLGIFAYIDGLAEETEGLVVYLDLVESELDPRDVGQVALERSTYLIRINPSGICIVESEYTYRLLLTIKVNCTIVSFYH